MSDYHTAIVFQGGGALGAYECGVIKALYEERPGFKPAVVTGISIGAINAAILVGAPNNPTEVLEDVWRRRLSLSLPPIVRSLSGPALTQVLEQGLAAFGNAGMYQLRQDFIAPRGSFSIYDLEPLRRMLSEVVDLDKLNQPKEIRLVVGAINVRTGQPKNFDNSNKKEGPLGIDHIIAGGSIPPMFPMTSIADESYWDGGLFQNTPLSSAINCLEEIKGDVKRELIVVELFPMEASAPKDFQEVGNRLSQLIFTSKLKIDRKLFQVTNETIEFIGKIKQFIPVEFHNEPAYRDIFLKHKKIDALTVITARFPEDRAGAGDFSKETIEFRIKSGYEDAKKQKVGTPHRV